MTSTPSNNLGSRSSTRKRRKNHLVGGPTRKAQKARASAVKRFRDLWRGVNTVLKVHSCPVAVRRDLRRQLHSYLDGLDEVSFIKSAKYVLCWYQSWYLKNELPEPPERAWKHTGHWRRWAKSRRFVNRANTHMWYSFLQCKRAASQVSEGMVLTTFMKHREQMQGNDPMSEDEALDFIEPLLPSLAILRAGLRSVVSDFDTNQRPVHLASGEREPESVGGVTTDGSRIASPSRAGSQRRRRKYLRGLNEPTEFLEVTTASLCWTPSANSCFEQTRGKGGQIAFLRDTTGYNRRYVLHSMEFYPVAVIGGKRVTGLTCTNYLDIGSISALNRVVKRTISLPWGGVRRLRCECAAVLEPLKVRVVSKGEADPYFLAKHLQKNLHNIMRTWSTFRLIGRPLSPTDLTDLMLNTLGAEPDSQDGDWFSVDYSSATDGLSANLSAAILRELVRDFPSYWRNIFLSVLAPHEVSYPKKFEIDSVYQTNGQLMGSPLSFPILCLANFCLFLNVKKACEIGKGSCLVNGDDMLYRVHPSRSEEVWSKHVELGEKCGLRMTVGKAYRHPVFANANSTCYHAAKGQTPYEIPYLNTGLLFGQNKVMAKVEDKGVETTEGSHVAVLPELLGGCRSNQMEKTILKKYLGLHHEALSSELRGRNLFIPESLGGAGVLPPRGWKFEYTKFQLEVAYRRICDLGGVRHVQPLPAFWPVPPNFEGSTIKRSFLEERESPKVSNLRGRALPEEWKGGLPLWFKTLLTTGVAASSRGMV